MSGSTGVWYEWDVGAYVLSDPADGAEPDVQLIGTGSEVKLCLAAQELLAEEGVAARVISVNAETRSLEDAYLAIIKESRQS